MRLLVVEDEVKIASSLAKGLRAEGYVVDVAHDAGTADMLATANTYDAILLDWMIPGPYDGPGLITVWRQTGKQMPVLLITARTAIGDRVHGLDTGADDYLPKPFSFDELLARVRALLRRPAPSGGVMARYGNLALDAAAKEVLLHGRPLNLTAKEFRLIEYLLAHQGEVISKDRLLDHVWEDEDRVQRNTVETFIANIRRKLGKQEAGVIKTVRGYGYKMG